MKKFCTTAFVITLCLFLSSSLKSQVVDDPDLPKFSTNISKEDYLNAREQYINSKRGFTNGLLPYNARLKALEYMLNAQLKTGKRTPTNVASSNWIELGPSPIPNGQTDTIQVPVSGRVTAIAVNNNNPNIVYVGTANGGIFRSMNGGGSWTAIFDGGASLAIGALALAPSNNSILYVGTGEPNLSQDSYAGVGVYRIDNCDAIPTLVGPINPPFTFNTATTTITTNCFTFRSVSKILVDPNNAANIFVSTATGVAGNPGISPSSFVPPTALVGLYRSTNATSALNSITFTKLAVTTFGGLDVPSTGNRRIMDMVMDPGNANNIVCSVYGDTTINDGGLFRTTNALAASPVFTQVYREVVKNGSRTNLALVKEGTDVVIYAATSQSASGTTCGSGSGALIKSRDGGQTWSGKLNGGGGYCGGQCFYDIAIAIAPGDTTKLLLGGSASSTGCTQIMQQSNDAGNSFITKNSGLHADSHVLVYAPSNPNIVYTGNDGGIFKSINGGDLWASINTAGFKATQFQSIAIHPVNPNMTLGGTQDNGTNVLKSNGTFNRVDFGDGGNCAIDQNAVDPINVTMYHTYFNQKNNLIAYVNNNSGELAQENTWAAKGCFSEGAGAKSHNGIRCTDDVLFYAPLTLGAGNPNTIYFGTDRLYRSTNGGDTNIVVSQAPFIIGVPITSIAVSRKNDNIRMVGLTNGQVYETTIGATLMTNATPPLSKLNEVGRVLYDSISDIAYVTYGGYGLQPGEHVWKTRNLSAATPTWTMSGFGIPDVPVNAFVVDPTSSAIVYAGTDIGVFQSVDTGKSWAPYNNNLPAVPIFDMGIQPVTKVLRVATHGRGFWETSTFSPLPVTFVSLTATPQKFGKVFLEWITSAEYNNKGYELQRALNNGAASDWKDVAFIPGAGTTSSGMRYNYDDYPTGGNKFYYRIKQVDLDGNFKYSEVKEVVLRDFDYALFQNVPNPSTSSTVIKYQLPVAGNVSINVYNATGAIIRSLVSEVKQAGVYEVRFNTAGLPNGNYYYKFVSNDFSLTKQLNISK